VEVVEKVWAGVDVGKGFHWAHVVDTAGEVLLSRRVENDEADLLALVEEVLSLAGGAVWAVDQPGGGAALLLALLWERGQEVTYVPGLSVDRARDGYRGESKTDRKDARVIADQARMRTDLGRLEPGDDALAGLQLLLARRRDLVADRTRAVTRLRETLVALFPALERALNLTTRGPLELVARYQSAGAVRRAGRKRVAAHLKKRGVVKAEALAEKAVEAAKGQSTKLPAEDVASQIVAELARGVLALKQRVDELDEELGRRFFARPEARVLASFPGMGPILGAEFLVAVGDVSAFGGADRLAAYAGLVPAARDSGKRVGNHRKGRGGNKVLKRVFYQSAFSSMRAVPESRAFYDRKRSEGKRHAQAVIALARRRVNVLWAMLRDGATFEARSAA
jgi:transposase